MNTSIEKLQEISNQIWNAGSKMTHNELDDLLGAFAADIREQGIQDAIAALCGEDSYLGANIESSAFAEGWNECRSVIIERLNNLLKG